MNSPAAPARPRRSRHKAHVPEQVVPVTRREQLRDQLPKIVETLRQRRADLVPEGYIADYVALDWLEWSGGTLRLTTTGSNICRQKRTEPA